MDKSKQIVGIAKNGRIFPFGSIKKQSIDEVKVTVDNGVGTPLAATEFAGGKLTLHFFNLKGNPGTPFQYSDFTPEQLEALRGPIGNSAVFDPDTGNVLAVLESTTGQSTTNAMTQKAVTDALNAISQSITPQVFLTEEEYATLVDNNNIDEHTLYNIYE